MSRGKSSGKPPSATRRNRSPSHHAPGSMSSTTAPAPLRMQLRSLRASWPPSRTGRVSTNSASYSSRSRSPGSTSELTTAPMTTTTPMTSIPASRHLPLGSPLTRDTSRMPRSPADKMLANWPNGSDASPMGEHYSTLRMMDRAINPTPSNYSPPLTSPMTPLPRASPDGSSTPLPALQPPSTPSMQPPMPPSTRGYTQSSSATTSSTRRPRLSMIASATSRSRFREFWLTSSLPLDVSREPEPQLAWDTSDSEPEAFKSLEEWGGGVRENNG